MLNCLKQWEGQNWIQTNNFLYMLMNRKCKFHCGSNLLCKKRNTMGKCLQVMTARRVGLLYDWTYNKALLLLSPNNEAGNGSAGCKMMAEESVICICKRGKS